MLDLQGRVLWPKKYWRFQFAGNLVACTEGGKLELRDNDGRSISSTGYDETVSLSEKTLLAVNQETGLGTIFSNQGQIVAPKIQVGDGVLSHGLLPVQGPDDRYGYIDANGTPKIPYSFYFAASFSAVGTALVGALDATGKYRVGLIDVSGKVILPLEYEDIFFAEDTYTTVKDNQWQILDRQLKPLIRPVASPIRYLGNRLYVAYRVRHKLEYQRGSIWSGQKARLKWQGDRTVSGVYEFDGNLILSTDEFDDETSPWPSSDGLVAFKSKDLWGFKRTGSASRRQVNSPP